MIRYILIEVDGEVALLTEGVDRNANRANNAILLKVALLTEGVDRNPVQVAAGAVAGVALLTEGVDRNVRGTC